MRPVRPRPLIHSRPTFRRPVPDARLRPARLATQIVHVTPPLDTARQKGLTSSVRPPQFAQTATPKRPGPLGLHLARTGLPRPRRKSAFRQVAPTRLLRLFARPRRQSAPPSLALRLTPVPTAVTLDQPFRRPLEGTGRPLTAIKAPLSFPPCPHYFAT